MLLDTSLGIYTYCLARTPVSFPHTITGIDGVHEVYSVEQEGIFAVLSHVSLKEYNEETLDKNMTDVAWLVPRAKRHEEVIEFVMTHATLNQHVISNSPLSPPLPISSSFSTWSKGEEERGRLEIHGLSKKVTDHPHLNLPPPPFSSSVRGTGGGIQEDNGYSPTLVGGVRACPVPDTGGGGVLLQETVHELTTKSGLMLGLGEEWDEIISVMKAIRDAGCDILTIGQYLSPKRDALPIRRYYTPEEFEILKMEGERMGFKHVESGPLVRSSYHAKAQLDSLAAKV